MSPKTSNRLSALALLEWGGLFVYFWVSGRIALFLHPYFQPWVLLSGLCMILTAGVVFFSKEEGCGHDHGHDPSEECGHDHDHSHDFWKGSRMFILLVPLIVAALFSPDRFGENILQNRKSITTPAELPGSFKSEEPDSGSLVFDSNPSGGTRVTPSKTKAAGESQTKGPAKEMELMDIIYVSGSESERAQLEGQMVSVTGQLSRDRIEGLRVGNFGIYQLVIVCCAADARPVSIRINYPELSPDLKNTDWVKVTGKMHFIPAEQASVPLLNATEVKEIAAPPDSYFTP